MEESRPVPDEQPNTIGSDACELLELSAHIYTQINPCETILFSDTRTKGKPIKGNLALFCCHSISFVQGVEKTRGKQIVRAQEQKIKVANSLRGKARSIRKKISIAKAEIDRLKENRKVMKRGKRNREILQKECKVLSIASLVHYMERQKCALRKLNRAFCRKKKNQEARVINQQFRDDAGRVYANMREMLAKNEDCDRLKYEGFFGNTNEEEREVW